MITSNTYVRATICRPAEFIIMMDEFLHERYVTEECNNPRDILKHLKESRWNNVYYAVAACR